MKRIYVECKPDKLLVRLLIGTSSNVIHAAGKGRVISRVSRGNAIGIVDEDPGRAQPRRLLAKYRLLEDASEYGMKIYSHKDLESYIIVLCPRLEEWILEACREARVDPRSYGLPRDPDRFHEVVNLKLEELENLLRDLINRGSRRIIALKQRLAQLA